jgi:outer membrane protein TolC
LEKIAKWGLNAKFLEIVAEVRDARANCQNMRYQIEVFRDMAQWVREQRDLVFSEYRNGRETITRLNEAQNILIEAQSKLVIAAVDFSKAMAQLAAATGRELPVSANPPETK